MKIQKKYTFELNVYEGNGISKKILIYKKLNNILNHYIEYYLFIKVLLLNFISIKILIMILKR